MPQNGEQSSPITLGIILNAFNLCYSAGIGLLCGCFFSDSVFLRSFPNVWGYLYLQKDHCQFYPRKCRMNVKFMLVFYGKVQVMGIVSFTCESCHSIELDSFSLNKSYKFENFLVKVEEDLIFLSIAFFNVERMISYLVAISKLSQNTFCFCL